MSKTTKKCRVFMDGGSWCCTGPKFENIQDSPSGFGDTAEEAYNDYLTDVTAMKAAKKLLKRAKKVKSVVSKKFKTIMSDNVRVLFIKGLTPSKVLAQSLTFNRRMECPLGDADVADIVNEIKAAKDWLDTSSMASTDTVGNETPEKKKKKKKSDKGSRNMRIHKKIVKAFKNGLTRAQTITLALKKNAKFNTPLCTAEVTNLVRIEWERLNPPSK